MYNILPHHLIPKPLLAELSKMTQSDQILFGKDYHTRFDPLVYAKRFFEMIKTQKRARHFLRCSYDVFQSLPSCLSILDYGSGPSILTAISAAAKASEIILSDYTEGNRAFIRQWLDNTTSALDWSVYFRYVVVELEGKTESDIASRKEQVRKLTKAVVPCDITQDPPIESGYHRQYDVVVASLVLTVSSRSQKDYLNNLKKLSKMVKPGGRIMICDAERSDTEGFYVVGGAKFSYPSVTSDFVSEGLKSAGFDDIVCKKWEKHFEPNTEDDDPCFWGYFFLCGKKKAEI